MENRDIIAVVQDLIEAVDEDCEGYRLAAEASPRADVRMLFVHYSRQRAEFSSALHSVERAYGGGDETAAPSRHLGHGWSHLPEALHEGSWPAIFQECERGEDYAMTAYRRALSHELPLDVQMLVGAQSLEVKAAHDKVHYLKCSLN